MLEAIGATPTSIEVALNEQFLPSVKASLGDERFTTEWVAGPGGGARGGDRGGALDRRTGRRPRRRELMRPGASRFAELSDR